jgi:hypothetical protein
VPHLRPEGRGWPRSPRCVTRRRAAGRRWRCPMLPGPRLEFLLGQVGELDRRDPRDEAEARPGVRWTRRWELPLDTGLREPARAVACGDSLQVRCCAEGKRPPNRSGAVEDRSTRLHEVPGEHAVSCTLHHPRGCAAPRGSRPERRRGHHGRRVAARRAIPSGSVHPGFCLPAVVGPLPMPLSVGTGRWCAARHSSLSAVVTGTGWTASRAPSRRTPLGSTNRSR